MENINEIQPLTNFLVEKFNNDFIGIVLHQIDLDTDSDNRPKRELDVLSQSLLFVFSNLPDSDDLVQKISKRKEKVLEAIELVDNKFRNQIKSHSVIHVDKIWDECTRGNYKFLQSIGTGVIIYDIGILKKIKNVYLHKNALADKLGNYLLVYGVSGSIVTGQSELDSDIDAFVVINDTDVRKMSRNELKSKLIAIVLDLSKSMNQINIQTYILTEYWRSLRDANPVIYTLLETGVPIHDPTGAFIVWKQLLIENQLIPSIGAINAHFDSGNVWLSQAGNKISSIFLEDLYYAILNPSQALLMQLGLHPTNPRDTINLLQAHLGDRDLIDQVHIETLKQLFTIRKEIERGNPPKYSDELLLNLYSRVEDFLSEANEIKMSLDINMMTKIVKDEIAQIITLLEDLGNSLFEENLTTKMIIDNLFNKGLISKNNSTLLNELTSMEDVIVVIKTKIELSELRKKTHSALDTLLSLQLKLSSHLN